MSEFFVEYGMFLAKTLTLVLGLLMAMMGLLILASRGREAVKERLEIKKINEKYEHMAELIKSSTLSKEQLKKEHKEEKKNKKAIAKKEKHGDITPRKRVFVINFEGDIKASPISSLREEITAILTVAKPDDEVFVRLYSGGGLVHAYGLASSQLMRIKEKNIPLTVSVDKVAASGGYMMACVADKIIAAPFAIIGSIGVIAQIPNFNRLLKKHDIDFEQMTAGEFKRTLTMFGENTDKAREKFREELEDTHVLFKEFIQTHRPEININNVATGEHWPASRAQKMKLVDELKTSDDYLLESSKERDLYEVIYSFKKPLGARMGSFIQGTIDRLLHSPTLP